MLFFFLFFILFNPAYSESIDSLKTKLLTAVSEDRVMILKTLSSNLLLIDPHQSIYYSKLGLDEVEYGSDDHVLFLDNIGVTFENISEMDSAIVYHKKIQELAIENDDEDLLAYARLGISWGLITLEEFSEALNYLDLTLKYYQQQSPRDELAITLNQLGICYEMQSLYAKALDHYLQAFEVYRQLDYKIGMGNSSLNLGNVYSRLRNNKKALENYLKAKDFYLEAGQEEGIASVYNNIGSIHDDENEPEKALDYYVRSLVLTDPEQDQVGYVVTLANIGSIYLTLEDYDKAYDYSKRSYLMAKELDIASSIATSSLILYNYFHKIGINDSAYVYLEKAYLVAKVLEQKDILLDCYINLSEYHKNNGEYQLALEFSEKYISINDTLYDSSTEEIARIQSSYENIEKNVEIKALVKEKNYHTKIRYYLTFLVIVLFTLVLLFFSLFKHKQREVAIIEEMENHKEKETSLRSIIYNISTVADETNDLNMVYHAIQNNLNKVINTTNFFIAYYNEKNNTFTCPLSNDSKDNFIDFPAEKTLSSYVLHKKEGYLGNYKDIEELVKKGDVIQHGTSCKCWLGVPLFVGGNALGVMVTQDYENEKAYSQKDMEMMKFFSSQISNILMRIISDNELKESEKRFRILTQNSNAAIFTIDKRGYFTFVNPAVERITGYSKEELVDIKATDITHPDHHGILMQRIARRIEGFSFSDNQYRFITKSGETRWMELSSSVINLKGESYILCSALDITESKQHEATILTSLKEKEILLKEIHHRVKNNMQIISSLLKLQSKYTNDEKIKELFEISQDRVRSMSLVHEKLYASPDLANIHIDSYIRNLISHLQASYIHDHDLIVVEYDLDKLDIDINSAIPCGLILNELLTNCLKYAFPNGMKGVVTVRFKNEQDNYLFSVEDDGIGMPENFVIEESDSLGLQLVSSLVLQLHGKLELSGINGSLFTIRFPKKSTKS